MVAIIARAASSPLASAVGALQHQHRIGVRILEQQRQRAGVAVGPARRRGCRPDCRGTRSAAGTRRAPPASPGSASASRPPPSSSASAAMTPMPPPLVRMASRSPIGALAHPQRLDGVEQIADVVHPQHAGAAEGGVVDRRRRPPSAPVCEATAPAAAGWRPALMTTTGFRRAAARAADMNFRACVTALDVEQDAAHLGFAGQVIQHIAEVDVAHVAQRDDVGEADAARRRPVEHRGDDGARLGDEGEMAGLGLDMGEAGVQADRRRHDAQAVGADDAQPVAAAPPPASPGAARRRRRRAAEAGGDHARRRGCRVRRARRSARAPSPAASRSPPDPATSGSAAGSG